MIRLLIVVALTMLADCSQHIDVVPIHAHDFAPWQEEPIAHRLAPGDEIELQFTLNPELNDRLVIAPQGQVTVPLLGPVDAAGKTIPEFTRFLKRLYASKLRAAELDVLVRSYGSERIYVGGEVRTPGMQTMTGPTDVLQGVLLAGGLLPTARTDEVVILRRRADRTPMVRTVNLKSLIGQGAPTEDVRLEASDIVYVPRSNIAEFDLFIDQYLNQAVPFQKSINANIGSGTLVK